MDLRTLLRGWAVRRPTVFRVALPGATELRLEVEAEVRRRGWPTAAAPADADLLVVCGVPGPGDAEWLDRVEAGMPRPAARIVVPGTGQAAHALDEGAALLTAATPPAGPAHHDEHAHDHHADHSGHQAHEEHSDHPELEADEDHSDHPGHKAQDHSAHMGHEGHMGHDMHAMGEVAGLPMAERGDDRDGLRLDRLHVPLGPASADWPAGLVLHLTLQGDVVQAVEVDHQLPVKQSALPFWSEPWLRAARGDEVTRGDAARRRCAAHLDSVGRLLAVVGWDDAATRCRRLRDEVLSGESSEVTRTELRATTRRLARSRTLHWGIAGLGRLSAERARAAGVTGPASAADGDAYDRLRLWLSEIERGSAELDDVRPLARDELAGPRGWLGLGPRLPSQALLDVLPELLTGAEFACARIILASLDPDLDELVLVPTAGAAHG